MIFNPDFGDNYYLSNLRGLGLYTKSDRSHLWGLWRRPTHRYKTNIYCRVSDTK